MILDSHTKKVHKTTKKEVRRLRNEDYTWRAIASQTSKGECHNQLCGMDLCKWAGFKCDGSD
jgi:hypothetical protein